MVNSQHDDEGPQESSPAAIYRMDRLRIRHFRMLEIIDRTGSLGGAARELGISQPAVTMLLKELEEVFCASLVERDVRGGRLTPAGAAALERLRVSLSSIRSAALAAKAASDVPVLRLGCIQVVAMRLVPRLVDNLERSGLLGQIRLVEGTARSLVADLLSGTLDVLIGWIEDALLEKIDSRRLLIRPIGYSSIHVVAAKGHPLAARAALSVSELSKSAWVLPRLSSHTRDALQHLFLANGFTPPTPAVESRSLHSSMLVVAASSLLTIAPDDALEHYAGLGLVEKLNVPEISQVRTQLAMISLVESAHLKQLEHLGKALASVTAARGGPHSPPG